MNPDAPAPDPVTDLEPASGSCHEATVIANLPNSMVRLRMADGRQVTAHVAQNTRMAFVRLVEGDVVTIELSPFDPNRARILSLTGKRRTTVHRASAEQHNPFPNSQREEP